MIRVSISDRYANTKRRLTSTFAGIQGQVIALTLADSPNFSKNRKSARALRKKSRLCGGGVCFSRKCPLRVRPGSSWETN